MKIYSVYDDAFKPYGRVADGYPVDGLMEALANTPLPEHVTYQPREEALHAAVGAENIGAFLFGGMPAQLGYCNGHNTRLNCLEYHRDSEINLGTEDFILLLARQEEMEHGALDTAKVKAVRVPKGVLIEVYATTLHYAPCHADPAKGFRVMVALPAGTNTAYRPGNVPNAADRALWARNKWLLAHPDSDEAKQGAYVGLTGKNLDIADDI